MCLLLPSTCSKVHTTNLQSTYLCINPPSLSVVVECALLIPLSQLSQKAGSLSDAEGKRGVWQSSPSPPPRQEGRRWRINKTRSKAAGGDTAYQLSGVSWVSMSTLQMGHFLLVANHWSTHAWWKRCMQGNLLQTQKRLGQDFKITVHHWHFRAVYKVLPYKPCSLQVA